MRTIGVLVAAFLVSVAFAGNTQSFTAAKLESAGKVVSAWPSDMIDGPDFTLYSCTREKLDGATSTMRLVRWIQDAPAMETVTLLPLHAHCQFAKGPEGAVYFVTTQFDAAGVAKAMEFYRIDVDAAGVSSAVLVSSFAPHATPLLFGDGRETGGLGLAGNTVLVPSSVQETAGVNQAALLVSTDLGKSWRELSLKDPSGTPYVTANSALVDGQGRWLVTVSKAEGWLILRSSNQGESWEVAYQDGASTKLYLKFAVGSDVIALEDAGKHANLLFSRDAQATWQHREIRERAPDAGGNAWDLAYDPDSGLIATAGQQNDGSTFYSVWATRDWGKTWDLVDDYRGTATKDSFADPHGIVVDRNGYVYSIGHAAESDGNFPLLLRKSVDPI